MSGKGNRLSEQALLAEQFEANRSHLRAVAYRMVGSLGDADDAVQEAWLRLSRSDTSAVANLRGWLTTVVARVCLDVLRSRKSRQEESLDAHITEPISDSEDKSDPETEAQLAESVGLALLVVLETLSPAERLAFVLHDMFAVPFDEIAPIVGRSPEAARQLASRARRRVQGRTKVDALELRRQREVVDAFLTALRGGDFEGLLAVLDPNVVVHADIVAAPPSGREIRGATNWARGAIAFAKRARSVQPALINGAVGIVWAPRGQLSRALTFKIVNGKIVEVEITGDPERLGQLDLAVL
jgi:RNA polymerase sigma-70 factor, ECF subfamily